MFQTMKPLTSAIIPGSQNIHISLHQEIISIWLGLTTLMVINKYSYDLSENGGKTFEKVFH